VLTARPTGTRSTPASLTRWTEEVEAFLRGAAPGDDSSAARMISYQMGWVDAEGRPARATGKHVRSNLCCWAAEACGAAGSDAVPVAAAIELIHNFTLVHDDVQDGDRERRGRPTVWSIWGVPQAINAGDLVFTVAAQTALGRGDGADARRRNEAARVLFDATNRIVQGQILDIEHEGAVDGGLDTYVRIVQAKTAALIGASLEAGAVMAGTDEDLRTAIRNAGRQLGLAFQIRDDWLGVWGATAVTGKSRQSDVERRKLTYPVMAAYEAADAKQRDRLVALFRTRGSEDEPEIRRILDDLRAAESTAEAATARASEAIGEIQRADVSPAAKAEFEDVARYVADRSR
jgi:geranylgeranyl diphosphate synthase, type I